jgi:hypothetical protein
MPSLLDAEPKNKRVKAPAPQIVIPEILGILEILRILCGIPSLECLDQFDLCTLSGILDNLKQLPDTDLVVCLRTALENYFHEIDFHFLVYQTDDGYYTLKYSFDGVLVHMHQYDGELEIEYGVEEISD